MTTGGKIEAPVPGVAVYRRNQKEHCESLVVAVHGMGDQVRNAFGQQIAELFSKHSILEKNAPRHQTTRLALGTWDAGKESVEDNALGIVPAIVDSDSNPGTPWLNPFAFAEMHWATLPRKLEKEGHRLEESTHWAGSVVGRVSQRHGLPGKLGARGPQLAADAVEGIGESLTIISRLIALGSRAGLGKFDLNDILEKYLADVQQLTEYSGQRRKCVDAFIDRMAELDSQTERKDGSRADIHIIAHSEGTVLAFLTLLNALHLPRVSAHDNQMPKPSRAWEDRVSWIKRVRSFTTIGSPIDKHLILWPEMWYKFCFGENAAGGKDPDEKEPPVNKENWRQLNQPIRWRNYYDFADPVGFDLDTARAQLEAWHCNSCFEFLPEHDHGFRRYPIPGKAHVDYFSDTELFGYIIRDAVDGEKLRSPEKTRPPDTILGRLSPWIPFVAVLLVHFAAVFILYKAVGADAVDREAVPVDSGTAVDTEADKENKQRLLGILGCGALLFGTTAAARILRLPCNFWSCVLGGGIWLIGAVLFCLFPGIHLIELSKSIGLDELSKSIGLEKLALILFVAISAALVVIALALDRRALAQQNRPVAGIRTLIRIGGIPLAAILVGWELLFSDGGASAFVLIGSGVAFVYLWWLGILLFDLAYIWGRYINRRKDDILDRLRPKIVSEEQSRKLCYDP